MKFARVVFKISERTDTLIRGVQYPRDLTPIAMHCISERFFSYSIIGYDRLKLCLKIYTTSDKNEILGMTPTLIA